MNKEDCCAEKSASLALRAGTKGVLDALHDGIKDLALVGGIDQRETTDAVASTTEHRLFVKDPPVSFARQCEPASPEAAERDSIIGVGIAGYVGLVGGRCEVSVVAEGSDQQTRLAIFGNEQLSIAGLGRPLHREHAARILETETIALVVV